MIATLLVRQNAGEQADSAPCSVETQGGYAHQCPWALISHAPNPVSTPFDILFGELGDA
jgi:hypothetical protein